MVKDTPSPLRLAAMVIFTMSVFGLLLFLWLAFGGSIPLKPEGYRVKVAFPEAATLAQEADVRLAGVNVGKVKNKELDKGGNATIAELEIKEPYAPLREDTRAILRQKTLLGETYVELAPGKRSSDILDDGGRLTSSNVEETVELDEIFDAFDKPTRDAFQEWVKELTASIKGGRGQDLNDAFGNLEGFAVDGATLLKELDQQEIAVRRLVKNTGVVFGAINERQGALGELIVNANNTFEATASRDVALAETFRVFPTFLDESKATLARLERFSNNTQAAGESAEGPGGRPRADGARSRRSGAGPRGTVPRPRPVDQGGADGPTGPRALPACRGAGVRGGACVPPGAQSDPFAGQLPPGHRGGLHQQRGVGPDRRDRQGRRPLPDADRRDQRPLVRPLHARPTRENGNAYSAPNATNRGWPLGVLRESFDCRNAGGQRKDPVDSGARQGAAVLRAAAVPVQRQAVQQARAGAERRCARRPRISRATLPTDPNSR